MGEESQVSFAPFQRNSRSRVEIWCEIGPNPRPTLRQTSFHPRSLSKARVPTLRPHGRRCGHKRLSFGPCTARFLFGKTFWGPRRDPAKRSLWGAEEQGSGRSFRRRRKRRQADFATTPWGGAFRAAKRHTLVPPPWGGNLRVCAVRGHSIAPAGRIPAPWTETLVPVSGRPSAPLGISPCPRAGARPSLSATQGAAPAGQTPLIPYESSAFISSISRS